MTGRHWIVIAAAVAVIATGCGKKEPTAPAAGAEKKFTIGYSQSTLQDPWRKAMNSELDVELAKHPNVTLNKQDAQNSGK
ncbi:MAG: hypothetical protein GYA63_08520, partial [Armatimonadetes bacterium]|nr:hypothetical protein [Armatimonadota bacterium]